MRELVRLMWAQPRAPGAAGPRPRDFVLLAVIIAAAIAELSVRADASWWSAVDLAVLATLPWRRSRPLLMVAIAFGVSIAMELGRLAGAEMHEPLGTTVFMLLLPYALVRWGAGREIAVGVPIILLAASLGLVSEGLEEIIGGSAVLLSAMAVGAAVRARARTRVQELEYVKLSEREQLARDLHDTVAHHVSTIAVRAHAGLATAPARPEAAVEALHVIAEEASRTLTEMRAMVRTLRRGESAELAPNPRIEDLEVLATAGADGPCIDVDIDGDLDTLPASVSSTVYRIAQESITNARRHARKATRIEVSVVVDATAVHLRVRDDGERARARPMAPGYGLLGMAERAELMGGTLQAGPNPEIGWTVTAVLPRHGKTT